MKTLSWMPGLVIVMGLVAVPSALAYRSAPPAYIVVDLTWKDASTGKARTVQGQLWFADLPMRGSGGKIVGLGSSDHFDGIKWMVPKNPGDIWIAKGTNTNPAAFILHDYYGEKEIVLAFSAIDVTKVDELKMDSLMAEKSTEIDARKTDHSKTKAGSVSRDSTLRLAADLGLAPDDDDSKFNTAVEATPEAESPEGKSPLRFASSTALGIRSIPVADIQKIVFLNAEKNMPRETYRGRFVEFSNQAAGDAGRVRVVSSTFFGGPDSEGFNSGNILADGTVMLTGDFFDLGFVDSGLIRVIGKDPGPNDYPVVTNVNKAWTSVDYPRRTPTLVHFSRDLQQIKSIVRLPWGFGATWKIITGPDEAVYISGLCGPHMDEFCKSVPRCEVVEFPEAVKAAADRNTTPGGDGYVVKLSPDHLRVEWLVRFKHAGVETFLRPDGKVLARRGDLLFFIDPDGKPTDGPKLDITGSTMAVDPNTGDMYFGGSYSSGTGLEPYVCPYLYKVDAAGKMAWTAYSWTGPIVGTEQFRLVSDSCVSTISVCEDGTITYVGWSDGGNTVLSYQPFDIRKQAPSSGFCSSLWGADGSTVRIGHIVHMDSKTMEVDYSTKYVAYKPTCDIPAILNIYSVHPLPNGDVAVSGSCGMGFVETYDAWVKSWFIEHRTNEFALAKHGTFLTVFRRGFELPRMATRTPGLSGGRLTGRGKMLLLYGCSTESRDSIIVNPYQKRHGGGLDAYVALIDTLGQPNPPVIPPQTWGQEAKKGAK